VHQWLKHDAIGEVYIVCYADNFVIGLQYKSDGNRLKKALEERFSAINLGFNESKTHLMEFSRFVRANRQQRGQRKPETFDFLGFTHMFTT
jgi:RNA-directed DNA polymerase